jgi:hypothetical protein
MLRVGGGARLLVVGDGDLSFSVGLVRHLCSAAHNAHESEGGAEQQQQRSQVAFDNCVTEDDARGFYRSIDPTDPAQFVRSPSTLQLTCTTYEDAEALQERYAQSGANAALLRSWGIRVLHGIDARTLESYGNELEPLATAAAAASSSSAPASSRPCSFHHILFHFPHVGGKSRNHLNRALLEGFLASTRGRLVQVGDPVRGADGQSAGSVELRGGCVHVSLLRGQGGTPCDPTHRPRYADHWQLQEAGSRANLVLAHVHPFHPPLYPGYNNKGFRSRDEEFSCRRGTSITHVLVESAQPAQVAPVPAPAPATVQARREDCVAAGCDRSGCVVSLDNSLLSPEMHELLRRRLCDVPGHPLQQVRSCIEHALSSHGRAPSPGSDSPNEGAAREQADASLRAQGLVRRPLCVQGTSAIPRVRSSLLEQAQPQAAPAVPAAVALVSSVEAVIVLDDSPPQSLQWNLDPALAVSGDLEAQMPLPLAVQLKSKQSSPSPAGAASNGGRDPAAASVDLADAPVAAVPFMCAGLPVLHEQRVVQLFDRSGIANTVSSSSDVEGGLLADLRAASRATMTALFGPAVAVQFRSSAGSDSPLPPLLECPARCIHRTEVLVRHTDGVWHTVARGGVLLPASASASSGGPNVSACGWTLHLSLDKLAMLRHSIPDVRWLWSRDARFLDQFGSSIDAATPATANAATAAPRAAHQFVPFALHPIVYIRDNSFWLNPVPTAQSSDASSASSAPPAAASPPAVVRPLLDGASFERIYTRALIRLVGSSHCVSVRVTDRFTHPSRGEAMRFRCIYQCVDRALAPERVAALQRRLHEEIVAATGVEMR